MKKTIIVLFILAAICQCSCKKIVQKQEYNALVDLMTNGVWVVSKYYDNGTDISASFSAYQFQFKSNGTVTGSDGTTTATGTWSGDIVSRTIVSDFPTSGDPVDKLNATWKITDSYEDSVSAKATISGIVNKLELKKH